MLLSTFLLVTVAVHGASATIIPRAPIKIVQGNDDGWGVANLRRLLNVLNASGFSTILSAPARQNSGTGSQDSPPPVTISTAGDFNLIPAGSPGIGSNASDPRLNYVDSFPVTAIKHGIQLAPSLLGGAPELVVSGPNVGSNLGLVTLFSGTIGIATEAIKQGIPAIAFSGAGGTQHAFTEPDPVADLYAQVALKVVQAVTASKPFLPPGVALNVNFPKSDATTCTKLSDFSFILSRVNFDINPFTDDVDHCGTDHLPTEWSVIASGNCRVSISVFKESKLDVSADKQKVVKDKISSLLSCM